jgi:hypothetical protein
MKYELWFGDNAEGYSLFPVENSSARALLSPDARLLTVFEAPDWDEACRLMRQFLGWEERPEPGTRGKDSE